MNSKICFVIPPSSFLLDQRVFPSLGVLRIAAVARKYGSVDVLDLSGIKNYPDVMSDYLIRNQDVGSFALTVTTPQLPAVCNIIEKIRLSGHKAKKIIGGPHVTLINSARRQEIKNEKNGRAKAAMDQLFSLADVLIAGDGEEAIFQAISPFAPRLIDADKTSSPFFLSVEKLNTMPFPARDLIDLSTYHYQIDGHKATSLIAQLGCPFNCSFCGGRMSPSFRTARIRRPENVVCEMISLYNDYGFSGFMFYDDELNLSKKMIELMCLIKQAQTRLGVSWRLRGFIKSELFTDEQAKTMYEAGFRWILVGFESGSDTILDAMNKKSNREKNTRCVRIAHENGLKVKSLMSLGHPGESKETILQTRDWLMETKPDDFDISIITCYPGTAYYDEAVFDSDGVWVYTDPKTGLKLYQMEVDYTKTADYYKGDPNGGYRSYVFTDKLSSDDLVRWRNDLDYNLRSGLCIPFNPSAEPILYESSMGQVNLSSSVLRSSLIQAS